MSDFPLDFDEEQQEAYLAGIERAQSQPIPAPPEPGPTMREQFPWTKPHTPR